MSDGGQIKIKTGLDNSGIDKDLASMSALIKGSAVAIGAAISAATAAIIGFGSAYETSFAKASTLFGDVSVDTDNLNKKILGLSSASGRSATELNESLYQALSAGVPVTEDMGEAIGFVDQAVKLATGGFTTSASAVDVMSTAINAYGMKASDASKVSDILIAVQNKGKTTVDELSSSLGRVLPVASAFNVSLEDVGAAEAKMTASGIATAESTTYLKSMLNELGDSGSVVGKTLQEKTGMSFAQLMDSGKSLGDIMQILSDSVNGDTTAFAGLWSSQEAGVGALSLANGGAEAYNQTLDAMKNSSGATEDAYDKMSNTFEFKANQMKESAKNLGISVWDDLQEPLKKTADTGKNAIDRLSSAIGSQEFKSSVRKAADGISDFAKTVGNVAKGALPVFGSVLLNIGANLKTYAGIALAAVAATKAFEVTKAVVSVVSGMSKAFGTAKAAVEAYNIVQMACAAQGVISNATITVGQAAVGVLTGQVSLATAATIAWDAACAALGGPLGLIITAGAALTAGAIAYVAITGQSKTSVSELSESEKALAEKVESTKKAYDESVDARSKALTSINAEYGNVQSLSDELSTLVDENGRVKEGYEDRANVITGLLSDALGQEITITDGVIDNYGELKGSIDQVIQSKKAQAVLDAMQSTYQDAINGQTDALNKLRDAESQVESTQKKRDAAQKTLNDASAAYKKELGECGTVSLETADALSTAQATVDGYDKKLKEQNGTLTDAQDTYTGYVTTIQNYEGVVGAVASGDSAQIESALQNATNSFITAENGTKTSLENQVTNMQTNYDNLKSAVEAGAPGVTQEMVDSAKTMVDKATVELDKFSHQAAASTKNSGEKAVEGIKSTEPLFDSTIKDIADSMAIGLGSADTGKVGSTKLKEYNKGIESKHATVDKTSTNVAKTSNTSLGSADTVKTGSRKAKEYNKGIESQHSSINGTSTGIANTSNTLLGSANTGATGSSKGSQYNTGLAGWNGAIAGTSGNIANTSNAFLGSANTGATGSSKGSQYNTGLAGWNGAVAGTGAMLSGSANGGLASANTWETGSGKASQYAGGISSGSGAAYGNACSVSSNANSGFGSADTSGTGYNFTAGFAGGMRSYPISSVGSAIGTAALNAIRASLGEHSPSKEARKVGVFFDKGLEEGMLGGVGDIENASEKLAESALGGLDMGAIASNMSAAVHQSNIETSSAISANVRHTISKEQDDDLKTQRYFDAMADKIVDAVSGMSIKYKEREVARMMREVTV